MTNQCEHGQLARVCRVCELETELAEITELERTQAEIHRNLIESHAKLKAEVEALRADAKRYRWLRFHYGLHTLREAQRNLLALLKNEGLAYRGTGMALDVSIDAAIDKERSK